MADTPVQHNGWLYGTAAAVCQGNYHPAYGWVELQKCTVWVAKTGIWGPWKLCLYWRSMETGPARMLGAKTEFATIRWGCAKPYLFDRPLWRAVDHLQGPPTSLYGPTTASAYGEFYCG